MLTSQVSAKLPLQFMIYLEDQQSLVSRRLKDTHFIPYLWCLLDPEVVKSASLYDASSLISIVIVP